MTDPVTELHALAVLDVLDMAQRAVDDWRLLRTATFEHRIDQLEDALHRLDRLELVTAAA